MRTATEMTTPSTICAGASGDAFMPVKFGFHLKPSMTGYVNSSLATVIAARHEQRGRHEHEVADALDRVVAERWRRRASRARRRAREVEERVADARRRRSCRL